MCWIYFLKFKSEVVGVFQKFKQWIKTQSGHGIQTLRFDNGEEYTSIQFNIYCEKQGLNINSLLHILHNKMESVRERIFLYWKWLDA